MQLILNNLAGEGAGRIYLVLNKLEPRSLSDTQGINRDAINIQYLTILREVLAEALIKSTWYSRSWSCDWYSILNRRRRDWYRQKRDRYRILIKLLETQSLPDTQQIVGDAIDTQQIVGDAINTQRILQYVRAEALIGSTRYSTNWRRDQYSILNKSLETRSIFNTDWQSANVLTVVKLIYN